MARSRQAARAIAVAVISVGLGLIAPAGAATATQLAPMRATAPAAEPIKACDLGFLPVKPIEGVGSIIGTAWAQCDAKPQVHVLTLSLDRRQGSAWVPVASAPPDPQIPPGPPRRASYQVSTPCQPGVWRVTAEAHGTGPTGLPFSFTDHSVTAFIQCTRGTDAAH